MSHESRLTRELRALLHSRRVAAMGTVNDDGSPFVSMTPYAIEPLSGCLVIHVSGLAAHTANLRARPNVSALIMQSEAPGESVLALPRVTLQGRAKVLEHDSGYGQTCRAAYLQRFPEAEPMTQLGDFSFVAIELEGARHVAGFGAARSIDVDELRLALAAAGND
jgi:heme iron utilization protein